MTTIHFENRLTAAAILAATLVLAAAPAATAANLVKDGDFESSSGGDLVDWTVTPSDYNGVTYNATTNSYQFGFFSQDAVTLSQTITGLVAGATHHLTFDFFFEDFLGGAGSFYAAIGGDRIFTAAGAGNGSLHLDIPFTPGASSLALSFTGAGETGTSWSIDNVTIAAVPGPLAAAGLPGLAALVAGAGFARLRRRRLLS